MTGGFPHVHLGPNAEAEPASLPRSYRLTVIRGEDETVRSVIGIEPHPWPAGLSAATAEDLVGAEHILVPKSVPQTPDLGQDYSPN
jgi:hypothetical protein